jgi:hypothetical protein
VSNVLLDYTAEDSIFILFYMLKYNSPWSVVCKPLNIRQFSRFTKNNIEWQIICMPISVKYAHHGGGDTKEDKWWYFLLVLEKFCFIGKVCEVLNFISHCTSMVFSASRRRYKTYKQ